MASAASQRFVRMSVTCPNCKSKQAVHIAARVGSWQMDPQVVECARCSEGFQVMLPDTIIDGPFLES